MGMAEREHSPLRRYAVKMMGDMPYDRQQCLQVIDYMRELVDFLDRPDSMPVSDSEPGGGSPPDSSNVKAFSAAAKSR